MDIDEILKKDGKDWTKEESQAIADEIKKRGRQALKSRREELNGS